MDARTILDPKRRGFWVPDRIRIFTKSINQYFRRILRLYGETRTCSWLAKIAQVVLFDCVWLVLWYQIWESLWGHILICCQTLETWLTPGRDYNYSRWRWKFEYSHVHPICMFRTCRGIVALYCRQWSSRYLHTDQCTSHDVKSMCWQPQDDKLSSLTAARTGAAHAAGQGISTYSIRGVEGHARYRSEVDEGVRARDLAQARNVHHSARWVMQHRLAQVRRPRIGQLLQRFTSTF